MASEASRDQCSPGTREWCPSGSPRVQTQYMHRHHLPDTQRRWSSRTETATRPRCPRERWDAISADAHSRWADDTHSNRMVRRLDSSASPVAPAPVLSLSNRARVDPIFPLIPGSFYQHVSRCLEMRIRHPTSCSFNNTFKEDFTRSTARQPRW